jgi:hypothetical protein
MRNALLLFLSLALIAFSLPASAQNNDFAVVVGAKFSPSASSAFGTTKVNTAAAIQGSVAVQVIGLPFASLQIELPFTGVPNSTVASTNFFAAKSYSSLYITPGLRLKLKPASAFNPWVAVGGGLARFNPSSVSVAGGTTSASGALKGTLDAAVGVDFKLPAVPLTLRTEAREFFSGSPNVNVNNFTLHNNVFAGIGLVLRF